MKSVLKIAIPSLCLSVLALGAPEDVAQSNKLSMPQMASEHGQNAQMMPMGMGNMNENSFSQGPMLNNQDDKQESKNNNSAGNHQGQSNGQANNNGQGGQQGQGFGVNGAPQEREHDQDGGASDNSKEQGNNREQSDVHNEGQGIQSQTQVGQESSQLGGGQSAVNNNVQTSLQSQKEGEQDSSGDMRGESGHVGSNSGAQDGNKADAGPDVQGENEGNKADVKSQSNEDQKGGNDNKNNFISSALKGNKKTDKQGDSAQDQATKQDNQSHANNGTSQYVIPSANFTVNASMNTGNLTAVPQGLNFQGGMNMNQNHHDQGPNQFNVSANATNATGPTNFGQPMIMNNQTAPNFTNSSGNSTAPNAQGVKAIVSLSTNVSSNATETANANTTRTLAAEQPSFGGNNQAQGGNFLPNFRPDDHQNGPNDNQRGPQGANGPNIIGTAIHSDNQGEESQNSGNGQDARPQQGGRTQSKAQQDNNGGFNNGNFLAQGQSEGENAGSDSTKMREQSESAGDQPQDDEEKKQSNDESANNEGQNKGQKAVQGQIQGQKDSKRSAGKVQKKGEKQNEGSQKKGQINQKTEAKSGQNGSDSQSGNSQNSQRL